MPFYTVFFNLKGYGVFSLLNQRGREYYFARCIKLVGPLNQTMKVLICDDSALARKSLSRTLANSYDVELFFAENGKEALECLALNSIDLFFLDLTMPVMDGYDVLAELPVNTYPTNVVVVSGDVQQAAKDRCLALGAADFIEKPFKIEQVAKVFNLYNVQSVTSDTHVSSPQIDPDSKFKELTNIALGKCAAVISDSVGDFINMPLPAVGVLEASDIKMTVHDVLYRDNVNAVTQRFTGAGIHGESLVTIRGHEFSKVGERLGYPLQDATSNESLLNISNLLVSTFLQALADLITVSFTLRQPVLINSYEKELLSQQKITRPAFTVEFSYSAENLDFQCDILLLIDMDSVDVIYKMMESF